jgi:tRNA(fMet)-specific endonuclease VapC
MNPPFVLDTDTFTLLRKSHPNVTLRCAAQAAIDMALTVITVEEQLSGWYTSLRRATRRDEIARLKILSFTEPAILRYESLKALRLNIGKQDLRIAAIALENNGTLVTRNLRDFRRVPGLPLDNWAV